LRAKETEISASQWALWFGTDCLSFTLHCTVAYCTVGIIDDVGALTNEWYSVRSGWHCLGYEQQEDRQRQQHRHSYTNNCSLLLSPQTPLLRFVVDSHLYGLLYNKSTINSVKWILAFSRQRIVSVR